jgi:hypothetical protein
MKSKPNISSNPFANARTKEEKERVWSELKSKAVRINRVEADKLMKEAIRLQKEEK